MYTVEGTHRGRRVSLTWEGGTLTGDPEAVAAVREEATRREEGIVPFFPEGPFPEPFILSDAYQAWLLIGLVVEVAVVRGVPPPEPERPGV